MLGFLRRKREERAASRRRNWGAGASVTPGRSTWDDSPMNPASPTGMLLNPLSPFSSSYVGADHSSHSTCHTSHDSGSTGSTDSGSSSCSDSGASSSDSGSW